MRKRKLFQSSLALFLTFVMILTTALTGVGNTAIITEAAVQSKGSLATEVTGTTGSGATNASLLANLPTKANEGKSRFTTANYDANNGAIDTSNWGTGMIWDLDGSAEPYGHATFAIPWSFKGSQALDGLLFSKPNCNVVRDENVGNGYVIGLAPSENDSEFCAIPGYATSGIKVDKITDWTYDIVMQKADEISTYMKTTMVQGSPFAYFEMVGTNTVTIERTRKEQSEIIKMADDGSMFVIRVNDPMDRDHTTGNYYDYYAFYAPSGTTWAVEDTSNGAYKITSIKATFPQGKSFFSSAVLTEQKDVNDDVAIAIAESYKPYAYNFVTDTKAEYSYNEETHILTTTYTYVVDKKDGSTANGTVMGILPHQYKNMSGNPSYMSNTFDSIRGTIKMLEGSSFTTELTFSGILPWLTDVEDTNTLGNYVDEYMNQYFPNGVATSSSFTVAGAGDGADTYWTGKVLNRTSNVMAAAESVGDDEDAELLLQSLKEELADWFTASGENDKKYFYYEDEIGSLFGFPESFSSIHELNDHHFHYGYFIYTAAQVALRDPEWGEAYSGIIKELIYDIACPTRNNANSRYPYLRNFAPFEGHSWASGHANFNDGNNQESSSEAINAWAGIILFGEAIGDEELRDLGIYLYTTEISAINNYWFDVDEDVLADYYRYYGQYDHLAEQPPTDTIPTFNQASMVWGGKYEYTTWFGANPMQVQGINLLPMNPSSFYLSLRSDYIIENWEVALAHVEERNTAVDNGTIDGDKWSQYVWNDVWSAYLALADTDKAIEFWQKGGSEEGESKAHTYQYIYSLVKAGKPDLTITSNATLSTCFVNDEGEKTYVAYNAGDTEKTVTFSDGKEVIVQPDTMEVLGEDETQGDTQYTIECYAPALDAEGNETNRYEIIKTVTDRANKNTSVTADAPSISGYVYDETHASNNLTGVVAEDGSLVLKAYYKKNTCTVTFNSNGGSEVEAKSVKIGKTVTKPSNPTKDGYEFGGWYHGSESFNFSTAITEDIVLTAQWKKLVENTDKPARGEWGIERKDADFIMYYKAEESVAPDALVAFFTEAPSADATINTAIGSASSAANPFKRNGEYLEFTLVNGAKTYSDGYVAYWFNWNPTPTIIAVSDIPNVGDYKAVDTTNYTVTFTSDGEIISSQLVEEGEMASKPMNPKKEGYTFAGWYLNGAEYNFSSTVTGNITLVAQWTEEIIPPVDTYYTVQFNSNGGSSVSSQSIISGGTATRPSDPTKNGYTFDGWYLNGTEYNFNSAVTGNITLVAQWTEEIIPPVDTYYTVQFNSNGGSSVSSQSIISGGTATRPSDPTRSGYTFKGWYLNGTEYNFSNAVTGNITLIAQWTENKTEETEAKNGLQYTPSSLTLTFWTSEMPSNYKLVKIQFQQYATKEEAVARMAAGTQGDGMASDTLEYNSNRGCWTGTLSPYGLSVNHYLIYNFYGETTTGVATKTQWNGLMKITSTGLVEVDTPTESVYTVTFNSNGGSSVSSQYITSGQRATKPGNNPTKSGYTFAGWYLNEVEYDFNSVVTGNITLKAKWISNSGEEDTPTTRTGFGAEYDASTRKITFWNADLSSSCHQVKAQFMSYTSKEEAEARANSSITGELMAGHMLNYDEDQGCWIGTLEYALNQNDYFLYNFYVVNSNGGSYCTNWATIKKVGELDLEDYKVTFDSNGGSHVSNQTIVSGYTATKPADPSRTGYIFLGWYLENSEYDFSSAVTSDITLIAKWEQIITNAMSVTLNKKAITLESGETETLVATVNPSTAKDKSVKWSSSNVAVATVDANGKVTALASGTAIITVTTNDGGRTASCTVTVMEEDSDNDSIIMDDQKYKVTFDSAGGTFVDTQVVTEGECAEDPEDPTRTGYDFAGWYKDGKEYDFDTEVTEDITLTAKWDVISIDKVKITGISTKIAAGKSVQLQVNVTPSDAVVKNVTWKLAKKSDSKYAKINSKGKVTTKKKGAGKSVKVNATITGLDGEKLTKTYKIYIKRHQVKKLSVVGTKTLTVKAGKSVNLKSKVKITTTGKSVNKTLQWTSSNKAYATVSKSGKVKANKNAKNKKVTITAKSTDGTNKKVKFTIKIK